MKASGSERVIAWAAAVIVLAAGGCTNSEIVGTSTGAIRLTVEAQGGAGRYDLGILQISQILVRPADDNAQGALGGEPIGLLSRPIDIDLNNPDVVSFLVGAPPESVALLSEGPYEVAETRVEQFTLTDQPPPDYGTECVQMVDTLAIPPNPTQPSQTRVVYQTRAPLELSATAAAELRLTINVPDLIGVFESRFVCRSTTPCTSGLPPCLQSYSKPSGFMLEPYLVFQQQ